MTAPKTVAQLEEMRLLQSAGLDPAALTPWERRNALRKLSRERREENYRIRGERETQAQWEEYKRTVDAELVQKARELRNALMAVVMTFKPATKAERAVIAQCRALISTPKAKRPKGERPVGLRKLFNPKVAK